MRCFLLSRSEKKKMHISLGIDFFQLWMDATGLYWSRWSSNRILIVPQR